MSSISNPNGRHARRLTVRKRQNRALHACPGGLEPRVLLSTVAVSGQANIYGAGLTTPPAPGGGGGGVLPVKVTLASLGSPKVVDFPSASGTVSGWAAEGGYNGPDGGSSWGGVTNVPAYGGISGIQDNVATMFVVGVFLGSSGQPLTPPPTLNVTIANNEAAFAPQLGQQFFIGNGRMASQALQSFVVPSGASTLYLGFAEVFGFNDPSLLPGYYGDNGGSIAIDVEAGTALPTFTAVRASTVTAAEGQSVTFTATVHDLSAGGPTPTGGTVTFSDQAGAIGTATLVNGLAEFTTSSLPAGVETVTASYGGTSEFAASDTGTIVTYAGNGTAGYSGNRGPATDAELNFPSNVAVDAAGDLFIADANNNVIREVLASTGGIKTVAGNGTAGYSGDGGAATAAELHGPFGLTLDAAGDLFIADSDNNVVREVLASTGDITTVAGNGTAGYSGDGGAATAAELNLPLNLALDTAGNLFILDADNNAVREVVAATGEITTVAGDGTAGYSGDGGLATAAELSTPFGLALDASGNLFIGDSGNNVVREVVKATGVIRTVAGDGTAGYSGDGGPAISAELNDPGGLALDAAGDLFVTDERNNVVREVVKATGDMITVAGTGVAGYGGDNGAATAATLDHPTRVTVDPAGDLFVADSFNNVIRETSAAVTVVVSPTAGLPTLTAVVGSTAWAPPGSRSRSPRPSSTSPRAGQPRPGARSRSSTMARRSGTRR